MEEALCIGLGLLAAPAVSLAAKLAQGVPGKPGRSAASPRHTETPTRYEGAFPLTHRPRAHEEDPEDEGFRPF